MDNFGNLPLFILYIFFKCISFFTTLFSSIAVRKIEPTILELCGPFKSISGRCSNVIWLNENVLGSKRRRYKFFKLSFYWKAYIKSNLAITVLYTVKNFAVISARHSYCVWGRTSPLHLERKHDLTASTVYPRICIKVVYAGSTRRRWYQRNRKRAPNIS